MQRSQCSIGINSYFEGLNKIGERSAFDGCMGYGSYIGANCNISGRIGRYCSIAGNVNVLTGTHPIEKFVSTHPAFYSLLKQNGDTYTNVQRFDEFLYVDKKLKHSVIIGNDVWIGCGVTLIGGITIADGSVVLAKSIVTKDVLPYTIVCGNPAKPIKKRFNDEMIQFLIAYKWWDKPENWLRAHVRDFADIERFKTVCIEEKVNNESNNDCSQ